MNLLNRLTLKNLKLNQKRTIVTVIGIILSVALLTAVASMFFSARASLIAHQIDQTGDYHYQFSNVPVEDLNVFRMNRKIERFEVTESLGYAKMDEIKNEYKPYVYVKGFSKEAFSELSVQLLEGRFPENSSEIVVPAHLRENGGVEVKVGDTLTLEIGTRMTGDYVLEQVNPYEPSVEETIVGTKLCEYKVVGIIERLSLKAEPYSAPGYTMLTYLDEDAMEGNVSVYVRYKNSALKKHLEMTAHILGVDADTFTTLFGSDEVWSMPEEEIVQLQKKLGDAKYDFEPNENLLMLETGILKDPTLQVLAAAGMIVVLIIIFTSVYCIKNSFDISITEKIRQYGMLSSIGATKKQIKRNVYTEAGILGLMGIPFGILSGLAAAFVLIQVTDHLVEDDLGITLKFAFSWTTIFIAVLLGTVTIFLSARKSANRASKIAPIQAIRNSEEIKITQKSVKVPKWVGKIFGIGGEISYKNLQRSKKKYRTTVISIIVCVVVFISVSFFVDFAFETVKVQYQNWSYNMMITFSSDDNAENNFEKIKSVEHVEQVSKHITATIQSTIDKYTKEYLEFHENQGRILDEDYLSVHVMDNDSYKAYVQSLGLDFEQVREKGILLNHIYAQEFLDNGKHVKEVEMEQYTYKAGDTISGIISNENSGEEVSIEIAALAEKTPFGMDDYMNWAALIVGEDCKEKILDDFYYGCIYIDSSDASTTQAELEKLLGDDYGAISNFEESAAGEKSLFTLIAIFLYGFITVIALIGVTNIFNTITTNMNLRRREFAMLKSIGMTRKEFNRMILLESFFYGMKSLLIGIPIGCAISYLIYSVLESGLVKLAYTLPMRAITICVVAVFLLIALIMRYSIGKINRQNMIETIRNENI